MEGIQKLKCSSCGITFMSENNSPLCPTCSENSNAHHHGEEHGCGCGGHWLLFLDWITYLVLFEVSNFYLFWILNSILMLSHTLIIVRPDWKLECLFGKSGNYQKYKMAKCDCSVCLDKTFLNYDNF